MTEWHLICLESNFIQTEALQIHCMCGFEKLPGSSTRNAAVQTNALHKVYCISHLKSCIAQKTHSLCSIEGFIFINDQMIKCITNIL